MATLAICRTLADEDAQDLLWGSCRPLADALPTGQLTAKRTSGAPYGHVKKMRPSQGGQPSMGQRLAKGWIIVGGLMLSFTFAMAVAHYVFGMTLLDKDTGKAATAGTALFSFFFIGGIGAIFLVLGLVLRGTRAGR